MRVRVIDLDESVVAQPVFRAGIDHGTIRHLPMTDIGPSLRLWATRRGMSEVAHRLADAGPAPGGDPEVTFLGSGDFHHVCAALLARVTEPVTVVHFDNHPDWVRLAPRHHCGAWVNRALDLPMVARVVTLGPCSDDLVHPQIKGGNLAALRSGRLHLYPWRHPPSRVWGGIGSAAGHRRSGAHLEWRCLADQDWDKFLGDLIDSMPTDAVWLSIDKDVLRPEDAITNWDQGEMPLTALVAAVRQIMAAKRVIGADVCGDYAPIRHANLFKRWESRRDQPPPRETSDLARNEAANIALLGAFAAVGLPSGGLPPDRA